jgi:aryl-alcohol dehydrogenase-like predicted oxidoreductase
MASRLIHKNLGNAEIKVSSLCFGTLTVSPLQCGYSLKAASDVFCYAIDRGINFFDTAALYGTYPLLKEAVKYKKDIVIATKDYCYDAKTAQKSVDRALKGIGRDYVDIFLLHEQESRHTIRGHWEAVEYLLERKEKGDIKAVGLSTHFVSAVKDSLNIGEIEIIHPIYNLKGLGIADGTAEAMKYAVESAAEKGKGIYLMKALGGGHLISKPMQAFEYALALKGVSSIAVGMKSRDEVDYNVSVFSGLEPDGDIEKRLVKAERRLHIHDWCTGCGRCAAACDKGALKIIGGKAVVDMEKCVLCGYCAARCKDFCIKVI